MLKPVFFSIVMLLFSGILSSCAATDRDLNQAANEDRPRHNDCISQSTIRDYQVLDDSNMIVTAAGKRNYHLVLASRAFGLRSAWQLELRSRTGRICAPFDEVIVQEGIGSTSFRIASIRKLSADDLDELLIRFGKKEPKFERTAAPTEVDSAEVEELD